MIVYYDPTKTPDELVFPGMVKATWLAQDKFMLPPGESNNPDWAIDDKRLFHSAIHAVQLDGDVISYDMEVPWGVNGAQIHHDTSTWEKVYQNRAKVAQKVADQVAGTNVRFGMYGSTPSCEHGGQFTQDWRDKARKLWDLHQEYLGLLVHNIEPVGYHTEFPEAVIRMMLFYEQWPGIQDQVWWVWPRRQGRKGPVKPVYWREQVHLLKHYDWDAWFFWHDQDTVTPEDIARVEELVG